MKTLHCFHEHEHKCLRSTLTSSMHNFPIASLFEKLFRHERRVNFLYFHSFLRNCMLHPQLNRNKKEKQNLLSEESKQAHTRISTPRYCSPATATEQSLIIPKCRESQQQFPKVEVISMECRTHKELKVRSIFSQVLSATDMTLRTPNVCFQLETRNKTTLWV